MKRHHGKISRIPAIGLAVLLFLAGCTSDNAKSGSISQSMVSGQEITAEPQQQEAEQENTAELQQPEKEQENTEGPKQQDEEQKNTTELQQPAEGQISDSGTEKEETETMLQLKIGETLAEAEWEDNESVEALKELCQDGPLTIQMSMYGGFEQVGFIGQDLPRNDIQTTTQAGDIVLYSGNQIVVFYGPNSWAYTRLGRVTDKSAEEMKQLLGSGDVTITIEQR